jgi:hypothetical protein
MLLTHRRCAVTATLLVRRLSWCREIVNCDWVLSHLPGDFSAIGDPSSRSTPCSAAWPDAADHREAMPATEEDVGIRAFTNDLPGFTGIIKQR